MVNFYVQNGHHAWTLRALIQFIMPGALLSEVSISIYAEIAYIFIIRMRWNVEQTLQVPYIRA